MAHAPRIFTKKLSRPAYPPGSKGPAKAAPAKKVKRYTRKGRPKPPATRPKPPRRIDTKRDGRSSNILWQAAKQKIRSRAIAKIVKALGLPKDAARQEANVTAQYRWEAFGPVNRLMELRQWLTAECNALMIVTEAPDPKLRVGTND